MSSSGSSSTANIQSLPLDYAYTEKQARAVSVDSRAILEALQQVYHADDLVAELTGRERDGSAPAPPPQP